MRIKTKVITTFVRQLLHVNRITSSEKQHSQNLMFHILSVILTDAVWKSIEKLYVRKVLCQSKFWEGSRSKPVIFGCIKKFEMLNFSLFVRHYEDLPSTLYVIKLPLGNCSVKKGQQSSVPSVYDSSNINVATHILRVPFNKKGSVNAAQGMPAVYNFAKSKFMNDSDQHLRKVFS